MRYYMCYLEAQAVSTFDPKGNQHHSKEKETTQPPHPKKLQLQKLVGCKSCTRWKWGIEQNTENDSMGNERENIIEKKKKGVNT